VAGGHDGAAAEIPGAEVVKPDAGCCGMAGPVGCAAKNYDISMKVGSDRLSSAIEAEDDRTVIAGTGTSCREQILHGTERSAWHPVELVLEALEAADGDRAADHPR
jgi:Fe-S oxidoreductase